MTQPLVKRLSLLWRSKSKEAVLPISLCDASVPVTCNLTRGIIIKNYRILAVRKSSVLLYKSRTDVHPASVNLSSAVIAIKPSFKKTNRKLVISNMKYKYVVEFKTPSECLDWKLQIQANIQRASIDFFGILPNEIVRLILMFVPTHSDVIRCSQTCKRLTKIGSGESFWKEWLGTQISTATVNSIHELTGSYQTKVTWGWLARCQATLCPKENSTLNGLGMSIDPSFLYFGEFKNGKFDGIGVQLSKSGSHYIGEWKEDEAHGQGYHISVGPRDRYEGEFCHGNFNGYGHYVWCGGEYRGFFKNGAFEGQGVCTYEDGTRYEGSYVGGKRQGYGVMKFQSGDKYEGQFVDGKRHGGGVYTFKNGDRHEGHYQNGKRHGRGIYTFANNGQQMERFVVQFENGQPIQESIKQLEDGHAAHFMMQKSIPF